jgi:flagellar basal body P-ring formation protein FlgA
MIARPGFSRAKRDVFLRPCAKRENGLAKLRAVTLGVLSCALLACAPARAAQNNVLPVPSVTIYPGDTLKAAFLVDRDFSADPPVQGSVIDSRADLIGKVARRTLLPGVPIPLNAVNEPNAVANGAKVRVIFEQDGLVIETYAAALQSGAVGQVISVRNLDSGLTIAGTIQADGSVRVGGG